MFADTTDVQKVKVLVPGDLNSNLAVVQCDFIADSDAKGCMVVLYYGENHSITLNLTRNMNRLCAKVNLLNESIQMVYGFDIEADGSIGALSIVGIITETKANRLKCDEEVQVTPTSSLGKTVITFVTQCHT